MTLPNDELLRLLVKGARQEGREEASRPTTIEEADAQFENSPAFLKAKIGNLEYRLKARDEAQAARVAELEAQVVRLATVDADGPMVSHSVHQTALVQKQQAENRAAMLDTELDKAIKTVVDMHRDMERVQGERDALAGEVDRLRARVAEAVAMHFCGEASGQLKDDALLGRLVRAIRHGYSLSNPFGLWVYGLIEPGHPSSAGKTPEEALRAAGVVAVEPDGVTEHEEGVRS